MKTAGSDSTKQTGRGSRRAGERSSLFPSGVVPRLLLPLFFGMLFLYPAILPAALVNGDFADGLTGWEATDSVYPDDGVAVMTEGETTNPASLVQAFTLQTPTPSLSIALSVKLTPNGGTKPSDGFQVFLLSGNVALAGQIADTNPGEILRIQPDGTVYYAPGVSIAGAPASGNIWSSMPSTFVMTVDLSTITTDVMATLAFDLTNFGDDRTSEVRIDNVLTPPTAVPDSIEISEDAPQTKIDVIANDIDPEVTGGKPDPATATVTIASSPEHGSVSVGEDKMVLYTPILNFFGTDSFTYAVTDGEGGLSNVATVTITVTAVNDLPVAVADMATTNEDTAVAVAVLANDTDVEGELGTSVTVTIASNPANGAVSVQTDKTIRYTPNTNFFGTDSFSYTVTDSEGGVSNATTVTVTVTAVNDLPVANDDTAATNEDTVVIVAVLANDTDVEGALGASATVTIASSPEHGSVSVGEDKTVLYTPILNFFGTDSFTYAVTDGEGGLSNVATVTITVTAVNDLPVAVADMATTNEDTAVAVAVLANDTDVEGELGTSVTVTIASNPANGAVSVQTDKTIRYTPNTNFFGTDSFSYTVTDSEGGVSNATTVTVTVTAVNDLPVANDDAAATNEDTVVTVAVLANDTDVEGALGASAMVTIASNPANGTVSVQTDKTVLYTPILNFFGTDSFTYTVTDGEGGLSNVATVTITVNAVNDAPFASAGADQAVLEGFTVALDGSLSSDQESGFSYTWSQVSGPTVSLSSTMDVNPTFSAPVVEAMGALLIFQLRVVDSGEPPLESTDSVSIRVVDSVKVCDVNDDKQVNLVDAVLMQKVLARLSYTEPLNIAADADGDGRLGIAEAICVLQNAAALRNVPDRDGDGDGVTPSAGDCDDGNPSIRPGATEVCNGRDDNCNGLIDEGVTPQNTYYLDADSDGYGAAAFPFMSCVAPYGFVSDNTDSNDADGAVH